MKDKKLIIYGIGKFAEYVRYVFQNDSSYEVVAFCIESSLYEKKKSNRRDIPLINFDEIQDNYPPSSFDLFLAVGNNIIRDRLFRSAKEKKFTLASYISSRAKVWKNLEFGENVLIDEGSMLQPFVKIGDNTILFASSIGHHTQIGSNCLLSACTTGGNVNIGDNSFIGMNSAIKQNIKIERNNIIGMGCIISSDTSENSVYTNKGTVKRDNSYEQVASLFLK